MASKIILVTGGTILYIFIVITRHILIVISANQGIGYEVVKQLGKQGHTVYLGARDEKRGKEAEYVTKEKNMEKKKRI